jgi:hypothetical protein
MGDHFLKQIENISNQQNKEFPLLLRGHLLNDASCTKNLLIKDIRQMIGKIIYEFRTDPEIWGVKIKK